MVSSPNWIKRPIVRIVLILLLAVGLISGGLYLADPYSFRMAPGVSLGGLDVSGMTLFGARKQLEQQLSQTLYEKSLPVELPCQTIILSPGDTSPSVSSWKAAFQAYLYGRSDTQPQKTISLQPFLKLNEEAILALLEGYGKTYNTDLKEADWSLSGKTPNLSTENFDANQPAQVLTVSIGLPDAKLDIQAALGRIRDIYADAICANAENRYTLAIPVDPAALPEDPDLDALYEKICTEAVSDSLDMAEYCFIPGSYGYRFNLEEAKKQLQQAQYGSTLTFEMYFEEPEILGEKVYFRDVLGSYETKHTNNENRNTNLRLLCAALDGHILQPGEEFSYNGVVGERTAEKGYKPAPAYSGNRLVDSVGGGVCQGSTTLYNCVLLADLEVVFRACHGATVGYVPKGLDAAVNYLTTDFKFRNNFHFPIMLKAEVSDGYVKMQILGTDEKDYYVKMEARSGEDDIAIYTRSYKCKLSKETGELISRDIEAYSTYYKNIG